jgi:hypothetical protein
MLQSWHGDDQAPTGRTAAVELLFQQSGVQRLPTLVTRADHMRLSVPVFGKLHPLSHDLAHYVIEREL